MRREFRKMLSGVLVFSMLFTSAQSAGAQESAVQSDFQQAEEIADTFIDSIRKEGDNTGAWSQNLIIEREKKLYSADDEVAAYCIEYTNAGGNDCGYVVVGANENYAPIIEYAMEGDFLQTGRKLYYLGDESISYYKDAGNGMLQNVLSKDEKVSKREEKQNVPDDGEYQDEWANFDDISVEAQGDTDYDDTVKKGNAHPPTSGGEITNPGSYESGWQSHNSQDVKNWNLRYFSTPDFSGYDGHCAPTAGINLVYYWYNRSSTKYGNLMYANSWNSAFAKMYSYMKTDKYGTTDEDIASGLRKYMNAVNFGNSVVKLLDTPTWADLVGEIEGGSNGRPFIFTVANHYLYSDHAVLAVGYSEFEYANTQSATGTTHSRYLRIADGWTNSANRYIHYKVGHDSKIKAIIKLEPYAS